MLVDKGQPRGKLVKAKATDLAFVAGFLEGDGCISAKISPQTEMKFGFRIRVIISFSQNMRNRAILEHIQKILGNIGVIGDYPEHENGYSELVIRDKEDVNAILKRLKPFLFQKKTQAVLAEKILQILPKRQVATKGAFLQALSLCEKIRGLNSGSGLKSKHDIKTIQQKIINPVTTEPIKG